MGPVMSEGPGRLGKKSPAGAQGKGAELGDHVGRAVAGLTGVCHRLTASWFGPKQSQLLWCKHGSRLGAHLVGAADGLGAISVLRLLCPNGAVSVHCPLFPQEVLASSRGAPFSWGSFYPLGGGASLTPTSFLSKWCRNTPANLISRCRARHRESVAKSTWQGRTVPSGVRLGPVCRARAVGPQQPGGSRAGSPPTGAGCGAMCRI